MPARGQNRRVQHCLSAVRSLDDPLREPGAHALEDISEAISLVSTFSLEACRAESGLYRASRRFDPVFLIGENIDVVGKPVDNSMGY